MRNSVRGTTTTSRSRTRCIASHCPLHAIAYPGGSFTCARVPAFDGVPLPPFEDRGDRAPPDGVLHHRLGLVDGEAIPGQGLPVPFDVEEEAVPGALREDASRTLYRRAARPDTRPDIANDVEVGPRDLQPDGSAHPRGEHVDARLDRHRPCVGDAGSR